MVFCPRFYDQATLNSWQDPKVIETLPESPQFYKDRALQQLPKVVKRRYAWAIDVKASLPTGFVCLKRKKGLRKGRTIIS